MRWVRDLADDLIRSCNSSSFEYQLKPLKCSLFGKKSLENMIYLRKINLIMSWVALQKQVLFKSSLTDRVAKTWNNLSALRDVYVCTQKTGRLLKMRHQLPSWYFITQISTCARCGSVSILTMRKYHRHVVHTSNSRIFQYKFVWKIYGDHQNSIFSPVKSQAFVFKSEFITCMYMYIGEQGTSFSCQNILLRYCLIVHAVMDITSNLDELAKEIVWLEFFGVMVACCEHRQSDTQNYISFRYTNVTIPYTPWFPPVKLHLYYPSVRSSDFSLVFSSHSPALPTMNKGFIQKWDQCIILCLSHWFTSQLTI